MRTYLTIKGPEKEKAIQTLESMAIDMPEVCIMDPVIQESFGDVKQSYMTEPGGDIWNYFTGVASTVGYRVGDITAERCSKIISESGEDLGDYDFFFEWFTEPEKRQIDKLKEEIKESLSPLDVEYTIEVK
jgi:hypothetical protein